MAEDKFVMVRIHRSSGGAAEVSITEVARRCGVHPDLVERLVQLGLVDFSGRDARGESLFHESAVATIRRILRLRNQLGVNYVGVGVILDLMDRIETLEERIRDLESRLGGKGTL